MASHNSKRDTPAKVAAARSESDQDKVSIIKSNLQEAEELSISTDREIGGDPYNCTGQHVILKMKQELPD